MAFDLTHVQATIPGFDHPGGPKNLACHADLGRS
jgi:hypothetical protein